MVAKPHKTYLELEKELPYIEASPKNNGTVDLIVIRPDIDRRKVLTETTVTIAEGLVGDNWNRKDSFSPPGPPHPEKQITLMNARCIEKIASTKEDWPLAGDQLFVDFDLSEANIPAGTELQIGEKVVLKVSAIPHNGCKKFAARFGPDAVKFINSKVGKTLHLRGVNAQVMQEGNLKNNDTIKKIS